jgi:RNA polymerase sigma-54 factor
MEHLLEQLHTDHLTEEENHVGELIISNLDGHGFNRTDPYSLLSPVSVTKSEEPTEQQRQTIERILKKVQRYEPIGCATSDWRQSVVIQAEEKGLQGSQLETFDMLVHFFLEKIREGKRVQVCKKLDITETQLDDYLELLKSLTPYPGNAYDSAPDSFIIPDISIHAKDGKLEMTTSAANLPDLEISRDFIELGRDITDKETKKYIKDQLAAAKELITQIKMRNGNIYKLGLILLERQSEYFLKGPLYLKPLTQKEVAQQMDVHETTVSRLANSKWIDCDWGIVPVKSLFSVAVATGDTPGSNEMSKTAIKEVIKQILEANEGKKALSDQKIANKLEEQGIKIARRTVAKYRKELNIDTAYIRNANL